MTNAMTDQLEALHARFVEKGGNTIAILQDMQEVFGYIPQDAVHWFSNRTGIPASRIYGVATFYSQFYLKPRGKHIVTACCGTACHVKGSDRIITRLQDELGVTARENTTADGMFTLERVACVGACSIAPVVIVDKKVFGKMAADKMVKELEAYRGGPAGQSGEGDSDG